MNNSTTFQPAQQPVPQQIIGGHNGFTTEICIAPTSLQTAYRLRYRAYLAANAVAENVDKLVCDQFDGQPNSMVHLIWYNEQPVATIRSCIYSDAYNWVPTEAVGYFPKAIEAQIGKGQRIVESNRLAVEPTFQGRNSLFAQMLLFRVHALNTAVHGCGHIITAVREKHIPFYKRFLGMEQISEEARYIPWADSYVVLMACQRADSLAIAMKRGLPPVSQEDIDCYAQCLERPVLPQKEVLLSSCLNKKKGGFNHQQTSNQQSTTNNLPS